MDVIVGTAGHIDHGKTSLVKALTGIDADRLPEEKQRGITIDLGFAEMDLDDIHIGFIDVPGHERFVKNMLAGASGIDCVMLIVAADEGVMPQTREHFEICRLLDTKSGIVVLTKKDLVDEETLQLVNLQVSELTKGSFLEGAPCVAVSSSTGDGIGDLKNALREVATNVPKRREGFVTRLPIDRSFSMKGFGAVVTGTLAGGEVQEADELDLLPVGKTVRVRGIQTHSKSVSAARAGQRVALNLGGVDHHEISRGMLVATRGSLCSTQIIDAQVEVVPGAASALRSRQRVRVHLGTAEVLARVEVLDESGLLEPGEVGFVQIRFEAPVVAVPEERFIIRRYSPQETIAGGVVIDNLATKHKRKEYEGVTQSLRNLLNGGRQERLRFCIEQAGSQGCNMEVLLNRSGLNRDTVSSLIAQLVGAGDLVESDQSFVGASAFELIKQGILSAIEKHHAAEPLSKGMQIAVLKEKFFAGASASVFKKALEILCTERKVLRSHDTVSLGSRSVEMTPAELKTKEFFSSTFIKCGLEVPKFEDVLRDAASVSGLKPDHVRKVFQLLLDAKEVVKISDEFYFKSEIIESLTLKLKEFAETSSDRLVDVPKFKDIAGVSRKYAIPLLEYFDREKVTQRAGDKRFIL